ncbi:MAG: dienelactone hydrolase family protein [Chthoniobacterales bacterium]
MNRAVVALVLFAAAAAVQGQTVNDFGRDRLNSSPRHADWVDVKSGEGTFKAFVVYPERKDKAPVVLVISEIFGLTDWVRSVCDQLAENGVIAVAPDLHHGQKSEDLDAARKATSALKNQDVQRDLDAIADYALTKIPAANGRLAVCGFCWGGGWAFQYATMNSKLSAAYSFYGVAVDKAEDAARVSCPVYGFYGENDERVDATIPKAEELMKAAGKKYEPVIYKGAGHGFMRDGEAPQSNDPHHDANVKARDDAWTRWKTLLKQL